MSARCVPTHRLGFVKRRIQPPNLPRAGDALATALTTTELWYVWAEIAFEHEAMARSARAKWVGGSSRMPLLEHEMKAALVAVTAAANAMDALQSALESLGGLPQDQISIWHGATRGKRPPRHSQVFQTISATFGDDSASPAMQAEIDWLFALRDSVVHFRAEEGPFLVHPVIGDTTPAAATYNLEATARGCNLLERVLRHINDSPTIHASEAFSWLQTWGSSIKVLLSYRGNLPTQPTGILNGTSSARTFRQTPNTLTR